MKYDLRPEFWKYSWIQMPVQPGLLKVANAMMPVIQHGKRLDTRLCSDSVQLGQTM